MATQRVAITILLCDARTPYYTHRTLLYLGT